jgi:hypothetical protein
MESAHKYAVGAQTVATLEATFRRYLALDPGLPLVLALWTLATYVFDCFDAFPYLAITSPTKRCGKTRLAEIIDLLSCNGLRTVGASPAAIFRTIRKYEVEGTTVTLILDEAEVLGTRSERSEQLREILNAGYRRGQYVLRCERVGEEGYDPQEFNVYCPKVLVLIGNLNDTLADRCIPIGMRRRKQFELVERFFYSQAERDAKRCRREIERWAKFNRTRVKRCHRRDVEFLEDREAELWSPLFAVCAAADPDRLEQLKVIALRVSGAKQADEPAEWGLLLLRDIRQLFDQNQEPRLTTTGMLYALNGIDESPWVGWSRGRGLDARGLARLLKPFGICPHNLRLEGNSIAKGYERVDFEEAWGTYLTLELSATALQPASTQETESLGVPLQQVSVADLKVPEDEQKRGV